MTDDSALLHRAPYDPVKAHQYYLRTRQLKGRRRAQYAEITPDKEAVQRASLLKQKEALDARLDRLRDILAEKVEAAKKRSGVETKAERESASKKTESKSTNEKNTPLTEKQKREKAEKAREEYEKETGGSSLSQEIQQLQKQIADIRKQIAEAVEKARAQSSQPQNQTASNGR